jgi:transcriptional regulator with XRE-family HTH domain
MNEKKRGMTPEKAEQLRVKRLGDKGTKLRIARVSKGLSQSELAAASGVPKKTIQRFEQEPNRIDGTKLNTLCGLCEALGCKITDIIDDKELVERFNRVK